MKTILINVTGIWPTAGLYGSYLENLVDAKREIDKILAEDGQVVEFILHASASTSNLIHFESRAEKDSSSPDMIIREDIQAIIKKHLKWMGKAKTMKFRIGPGFQPAEYRRLEKEDF